MPTRYGSTDQGTDTYTKFRIVSTVNETREGIALWRMYLPVGISA